MNSSEKSFIWAVSFRSRRMLDISWQRGECFGSKYFASKDNTWWKLCFYPLGDLSLKREVTLHICRQSSGTKVFVEGEILLYSRGNECKFPIRQSLSKTDTYIRVPLYKSLREMYKYFPSGQELFVKCEIDVCDFFNDKSGAASESSDGTSATSESSLVDVQQTVNFYPGLEKLSDDLKFIFEKECFSDVTLRCDNLILRAHKTVLSARSKKFAKLLDLPSPETTDTAIAVKTMEGRVLKEMVSYIYTGRTSGLSRDMAQKLFIASKDYGLEKLQSICYDFLVSKMTLYTVVDVLLFAVKHKSEELKKPSLDFLLGHFSEIKNTESWKKFVKKEPGLGVQILSSIVETSKLNKPI